MNVALSCASLIIGPPTEHVIARMPWGLYVLAMTSFSDFNGLWTGSYGYPGAGDGASFTAWLDDQNGQIGGTILEANTFAASPAGELSSSISGMRSGSEIAFTKLYDPGQGAHDYPIQYIGKANSDFTWIVGRWHMTGNWSGPFEMSRQSGSLEKAQQSRQIETII